MKASIPSMMTVPTTNWPPGSYLLRLDASTGVQSYVPITIRSPSVARAHDTDRDPAEQPNRVLHLYRHAQHTGRAIAGLRV